MRHCEEIAREHESIDKVAVIAGVGVRNFYRKIGYELEGEGEMMIKSLARRSRTSIAILVAFSVVILAVTVRILLRYYNLNGM